MEMKAKSFLGLLLILALALGLIPGMTMTAAADDDYKLWVNGEKVTSENMADVLYNDLVNKGKVSYTPKDGDKSPATLTLKGVKLVLKNGTPGTCAIRHEGTGIEVLKILLTDGTSNVIDIESINNSTGIRSKSNLHLREGVLLR